MDAGYFAGAVYVYRRGVNWQLEQTLYPSEPQSSEFGRAVATESRRIAIGAKDAADRWLVYIFEPHHATGQWIETAKIRASDRGTGPTSTPRIDLEGDRLAVGSYSNSEAWQGAGAVFTYRLQPDDTWTLTQRLYPTDTTDKGFGGNLSMSSGQLLVAPWWDHAYLFRLGPKGDWAYEALLVHGAQGVNVKDVDIDGDVAMISNSRFPGVGSIERLRIFKRVNGAWNDVQTVPAPITDSHFGFSLDVEGSSAIVGAISADCAGGGETGCAYVYRAITRASWALVETLRASDGFNGDDFGWAVAASGSSVAVGAPNKWGTSYYSAGGVYLFDL